MDWLIAENQSDSGVKVCRHESLAIMKVLWTILSVAIILLQVRLWIGEGSFAQAFQLQAQIDAQLAENQKLAERNELLFAEVDNLRQGVGAIEERARMNLGMIREGETFFLVAKP